MLNSSQRQTPPMIKPLKLLFSIVFLQFTFHSISQSNHLHKSWEKQVKPIANYILTFNFSEKFNDLGHSFYPWQQTHYTANGQIWSNANKYSKLDTLKSGKRVYYSKTHLNKDEILFLDYGDKKIFPATTELFMDQTFKTAKYLPTRILNHFKIHNIQQSDSRNVKYAVYTDTINGSIVNLYIDKSTNLLIRVTTLSHDDLFGDVLTTYTYSNFIKVEDLNLALDVKIQKINGKLVDEVHLTNPTITDSIPPLLERPVDYKLVDKVPEKTEVKTEKFNKSIHLIELVHTDDRVMLVEFSDFFLVAESPLNSENGELIIAEARKIAANKPIKYFVFGHYHPHYLGGVRPFVHKGAKIISSKEDEEYVSYIVNAKHTLNPDSLQLEPKPLVFEKMRDSLTISDDSTKMVIYFIGEKSKHTKDYLIYYFPNEKLLFEDDLVWIKKDGKTRKASGRQAGLYNAINDLGIDVKTIIQSWPVAEYGVKTVIPFEDLEKSINVK